MIFLWRTTAARRREPWRGVRRPLRPLGGATMGIRPSPRRRRIGVGLAATLMVAGLTQAVTTSAASAIPAQEPGVTLRVFSVPTPVLTALCTLKAGQTPNIDKLMPTI